MNPGPHKRLIYMLIIDDQPIYLAVPMTSLNKSPIVLVWNWRVRGSRIYYLQSSCLSYSSNFFYSSSWILSDFWWHFLLLCFSLGRPGLGSKSYNIHHHLEWDYSNWIRFDTASRDSEGSALIRTVRSEIEIIKIWKCLFVFHEMDVVSLQKHTLRVSLENKRSQWFANTIWFTKTESSKTLSMHDSHINEMHFYKITKCNLPKFFGARIFSFTWRLQASCSTE